jgi:hypothetical protein
MQEKSISREDLLSSFGTLATQFTSSLAEAQALEQSFEASRARLVQTISGHLRSAQKSLAASNPLQEALITFVDAMAEASKQWDAAVAGREKGVKFREGFEDSLLVFVGGKVKSGKSSLGNYMAWGHTDPTDDIKGQTRLMCGPEYKSHENTEVDGGDGQKEAEKRREFRVGATEATSSIQSFSLPGLTWVDSPGLHSLKEENGKLALEYLDHADLILYTMKSDAPGRASDLEEIEILIRKDKRMLLLITGSDDVEEDISDSGGLIQKIVMKDAARRAMQRDYVRGELKQLQNINKLEIVSISSRYAQEHANDPAAFLDSGIGPFCATLQEICQSEGVKIKQRVPMRNLKNFLDDCEQDLKPFPDLMKRFEKRLSEIKDRLEKQVPAHVRSGQKEIARFVDKFFDGLESDRNDATRIDGQLKKFNSELGKEFEKIASNHLQAIADELIKDFETGVKSTYRNSLLARIPDFKIETVTEKVVAGTSSGTKKRNSLIGTVAGGAIGFLIGGPAGAALGASLGGMGGSAIGDGASVRYRDVQVTVGDNLQDIRRKLLDSHNEALDMLLQKRSEELRKEFSASIKALLKNLSDELDRFESDLQKMIDKTQLALGA